MFDTSQAYMGTMVANETHNNLDGDEIQPAKNLPKSPEEIIQYAREEAAEILENAQAQADELIAERRAQADEEANAMIAEKVNSTYASLGNDLWSVQSGIVEIVEQSINLMIGAVGNEKAFNFCVEKATQEYLKSNNLKVHAHPDSANRLRLYNISKPNTKTKTNYEIIDDTGLEPDRCILDTGEKRVEVSLDVQIQALKRSLENTLSQGKE